MYNLFLGFKILSFGKTYYSSLVKNFGVVFFDCLFNNLTAVNSFKQLQDYSLLENNGSTLFNFSNLHIFFLSNKYLFDFFKFWYTASSRIFFFKFLLFRVFKAHGINMRIIKRKKNLFFLRVGFGHGFLFRKSSFFNIKIYRKRYFIVYSYDLKNFELFSYHLRYLRRFFKYKLIGVKAQRDSFKIKIGKKKSF